MKPNPLFLLFFLLLFANCKKEKKEIQLQYPEDPSTTTLTPRERLAGVWDIYEYTFKGDGIVVYLDTLFSGKSVKDASVMYNNVSSSSAEHWQLFILSSYFNIRSATAFKVEDPSHIVINGAANPYVARWFITPFVYDTSNYDAVAKWKITKLFDKDLNLVLETDSGDYKIFFKKGR